MGAQVLGVTLSPAQVQRGNELAEEFEGGGFDLVWACESGEHMPDKKRYIEEMVRVLKPGGKLVMATWCQRDDKSPQPPFSAKDRRDLQYLYEEWSHPYFISKEAYRQLALDTGSVDEVHIEDWKEQTIASWRHSIWAGVWDPWPVVRRPKVWIKTVRDIVCLERFHRGMKRGLMEYGMMKTTKKELVKEA